MNVTVTESARDYIKTKVASESGVGLRISIKKTGCSGYSYAPSIVTDIKENDEHLDLGNDLHIYVDPKWIEMIDGVTVDYVEEDKTGLKQKKLVFVNPKESGRCGCGESFHV